MVELEDESVGSVTEGTGRKHGGWVYGYLVASALGPCSWISITKVDWDDKKEMSIAKQRIRGM